ATLPTDRASDDAWYRCPFGSPRQLALWDAGTRWGEQHGAVGGAEQLCRHSAHEEPLHNTVAVVTRGDEVRIDARREGNDLLRGIPRELHRTDAWRPVGTHLVNSSFQQFPGEMGVARFPVAERIARQLDIRARMHQRECSRVVE